MLETFLLVVLLVYCIRLYGDKPKNFPPGPPRLPLWGSYWYILKENYHHLHKAFVSLGKKYKTEVLGVYLGDFPTVIALNHELSKELLTREEFLGRPDTCIARERGFGELIGIFFIEGPKWKEQRRFALRHMRDFGFGRRSERMEDFVRGETSKLIEQLTLEPGVKDGDVCRKKGEILMPDFFFPTLINCIMYVLAGRGFEDELMLRKVARAAARFQRSIDATGGAIVQTPWLRHFGPDFFGYNSASRDNGYMLDFLRVGPDT